MNGYYQNVFEIVPYKHILEIPKGINAKKLKAWLEKIPEDADLESINSEVWDGITHFEITFSGRMTPVLLDDGCIQWELDSGTIEYIPNTK